MAWIIQSKIEPDLAWSNTLGWTSEAFDTFSDREQRKLNPPIGGEWVQVPWRVDGEVVS